MSQLSHIHDHQAPTPEETRRVLGAQVNKTRTLVEKALEGVKKHKKEIIEKRQRLEEIYAVCEKISGFILHSAYLVKDSGDVNIKDASGETILTHAIHSGYGELTEILLAHPDIQVNEGRRGKAILIGMVENLSRTREAKFLLAHPDIQINKGDNHGNTALTQASKSGNIEIVQALIEDPRLDFRKYNQGVRAIKKTKDQRIRKLIRAKMREQGIEF